VDITPATAVAMSQLRVQNEYAMNVLKKTVDIGTEQGAALIKMMAQQSGVGQRMDLFA